MYQIDFLLYLNYYIDNIYENQIKCMKIFVYYLVKNLIILFIGI